MCTDPQAVAQLQDRITITDYVQTQAVNHVGSEYKNKQYPRADRASS